MTTQERIKKIAERVEKATPGEWEEHNWDVMERPHVVAHSLWNGKDTCNGHFDVPCTPENTSFIAHAKQDLPFLLSHIKRIEADLAIARESLEWYSDGLYPGDESMVDEINLRSGRRARECLAKLSRVDE